MNTCLNCEKSEQEVPLITLQYRGEQVFLCSQCFPTLLHASAKLAGKLADAEKLQPVRHD